MLSFRSVALRLFVLFEYAGYVIMKVMLLKGKVINLLLLSLPLMVGIILFVVFQTTDPAMIGPGGILGVFALIYLGCLSLFFVVLRFGLYWLAVLARRHSKSKRVAVKQISSNKAYYVASVLAFAPVTLLAMQAFSKIQWTDIALVFMLMAIVTFYVLKRS